MDLLEDDILGYERPECTNYYAYVFASTLIVGLPLLFLLLYKMYTDNVRVQSEENQRKHRTNLIFDVTHDRMQNLLNEMKLMEEQHERERYEWQAKHEEIRKDHEQATDLTERLISQASFLEEDKAVLRKSMVKLEEENESEKRELRQEIQTINDELERKRLSIDEMHTKYHKMIKELKEEIEQRNLEIKKLQRGLLDRLKRFATGAGDSSRPDTRTSADNAGTTEGAPTICGADVDVDLRSYDYNRDCHLDKLD